MKTLDGATFRYDGSEVTVRAGYYEDRSVALAIEFDVETAGKLTVSVPGTKLGYREVLVKTRSENQGLAAAALASGIFEDTGRRISAGSVDAQVWRVVDDYDFPSPEGGIDFDDDEDEDDDVSDGIFDTEDYSDLEDEDFDDEDFDDFDEDDDA
jgi:hypothetical protein